MTTNFARFAEHFDQTATYEEYVQASEQAHALGLTVQEYLELEHAATSEDLSVEELLHIS